MIPRNPWGGEGDTRDGPGAKPQTDRQSTTKDALRVRNQKHQVPLEDWLEMGGESSSRYSILSSPPTD